MAQNVIINGVTYQNVPEVDIPKSGGGTAKFFDTTGASVAAGDLLTGKTAGGGTVLETVFDQGLGHLIQRIHLDMHQFMDNDFFDVFLIRGHSVQQQDRFPVIAVNLKIPGFPPFRIFNEFQLHIPGGGDPELADIFLKQSGYFFPVHFLFLHMIGNGLYTSCTIISKAYDSVKREEK